MAIQTEDLLKLVQGSAKQPNADIVPGLAAFGIGMLVGAGAALLFAPASGEEVRARLSNHVDDLKDSLAAAVDSELSDGLSDAPQPTTQPDRS